MTDRPGELVRLSLELSDQLARSAGGDAIARGDQLEAELAAAAEPVDPRRIPSRFSLLKWMNECPLKYRHEAGRPQDDSLAARLGGLAGAGSDKAGALLFGTAVHGLLLGKPVALYPGPVRRGKVYDAFKAEADQRGAVAVLIKSEWTSAHAVADAIRRDATAMRLLFDGTTVEQRIDWTWCGKEMRSTPDAFKPRAHVAELKTAASSKPDLFVWQGRRFFYHAQAALYGTCLEESGHGPIGESYVIAVEKRAPHPVSIFRFTEAALRAGSKLCRLWMEQVLVCEAANHWPPYLLGIGDFDVDVDGFEPDGESAE